MCRVDRTTITYESVVLSLLGDRKPFLIEVGRHPLVTVDHPIPVTLTHNLPDIHPAMTFEDLDTSTHEFASLRDSISRGSSEIALPTLFLGCKQEISDEHVVP